MSLRSDRFLKKESTRKELDLGTIGSFWQHAVLFHQILASPPLLDPYRGFTKIPILRQGGQPPPPLAQAHLRDAPRHKALQERRFGPAQDSCSLQPWRFHEVSL